MAKNEQVYSAERLVDVIVQGVQEVKGVDIVHLDLRALPHAVTKHFIVCNGGSDRQVQAIFNSVGKFTKQHLNERPWHVEGTENADWILMDYVDVVLHIFTPEKRVFYGIEELWGDAERITFENVA